MAPEDIVRLDWFFAPFDLCLYFMCKPSFIKIGWKRSIALTKGPGRSMGRTSWKRLTWLIFNRHRHIWWHIWWMLCPSFIKINEYLVKLSCSQAVPTTITTRTITTKYQKFFVFLKERFSSSGVKRILLLHNYVVSKSIIKIASNSSEILLINIHGIFYKPKAKHSNFFR